MKAFDIADEQAAMHELRSCHGAVCPVAERLTALLDSRGVNFPDKIHYPPG
jgi:hypothetical protein